jgi:predicted ester cyclase
VTTTEANKQAIRSLFQAMNEHQVGDLPDYIAADVIDHNKIIHGEADEPGAAFDGFAQQLAAFPDIAMAPQELIAEGDQVVVRFMASGTHTGSHPRMPQPTGRHLTGRFHSMNRPFCWPDAVTTGGRGASRGRG